MATDLQRHPEISSSLPNTQGIPQYLYLQPNIQQETQGTQLYHQLNFQQPDGLPNVSVQQQPGYKHDIKDPYAGSTYPQPEKTPRVQPTNLPVTPQAPPGFQTMYGVHTPHQLPLHCTPQPLVMLSPVPQYQPNKSRKQFPKLLKRLVTTPPVQKTVMDIIAVLPYVPEISTEEFENVRHVLGVNAIFLVQGGFWPHSLITANHIHKHLAAQMVQT
ncbi:hypothetical protein K440DRAFT_642050 [Wilcoxina mikolae CBS 423.85]|nr:hypothetical protein K440DRAFT_642050 [Wilcoxina mikolae CBS 423.85]